MNRTLGTFLLLTMFGAMPAGAQEIVRRQLGDFPIASSVWVPAGAEFVFLSGNLQRELAASGLTFADVVKMSVFLVDDPAKEGRLPARTTVQVAGPPLPGGPVEIEVIAARVAR